MIFIFVIELTSTITAVGFLSRLFFTVNMQTLLQFIGCTKKIRNIHTYYIYMYTYLIIDQVTFNNVYSFI